MNKSRRSPEHLSLSLSHSSSHLRRFREDTETIEPISLGDIAQENKGHIDEQVLNEMEERAKSRLSIYDGNETPDSGRLSRSLHSFSYGPTPSRNSMIASPGLNKSLNASWNFYNFIGPDENEIVFNGNNRKLSEAILTIDARTSRILMTNQTACRLFGYTEEELCSMKINNLFTMEDAIKQEILIERHVDADGNVVMASGKVLEGVDSKGNVFVVSVWMKRLSCGDDPRCVVIMEPIDVTKASFLFNAEGTIEDCDVAFSFLHGYNSPQDVVGMNINKIIPALMLPVPGEEIPKGTRSSQDVDVKNQEKGTSQDVNVKNQHVKKQRATSRTKDTVPFPTTIKIRQHDPEFHQLYLERTPTSRQQLSKLLYKGFMWVFANVSGLVSVASDGKIHSCNENFLRTFLGYIEAELIGENITQLIPHFYEQIELLCDDHNSRGQSRNSNMGVQEEKKPISSPEYETSAASSMTNIRAGLVSRNEQNETSDDSFESISTVEELSQLDNKFNVLIGGNPLQANTSSQQIQTKTTKPLEPVHIPALSDIISKRSSSSLDGFSPHLCASTPKQSENKTLLDHTGNTPEIQRLDFPKDDPQPASNDVPSEEILPVEEKTTRDEISPSTVPNETKLTAADKNSDESSLNKNLPDLINDKCMEVKASSNLSKETNILSNNPSSDTQTSSVIINEIQPETKTFSSESTPSSEGVDPLENLFSSNEHPAQDSDEAVKATDVDDSIAMDDKTFSHRSDEDIFIESEENRNMLYDTPIMKKPYRNHDRHGGGAYDSSSESSKSENIETITGDLKQLNLKNNKPCQNQPKPKTNDYESSISILSVLEQESATEVSLDEKRYNPETLRHAAQELHDISHHRHERRFAWGEEQKARKIVQGHYYGQAKHRDTSMLPILFEIKKLSAKDKNDLYCVWISRDPDEDGEFNNRLVNQQDLIASYNSTLNASAGNFHELFQLQLTRGRNKVWLSLWRRDISECYTLKCLFSKLLKSMKDSSTDDPGRGPYNTNFVTLQCIGKGAFGFVNLAQRKSNDEQVVVKFIRKEKVLKDGWIDDVDMGRVPFEIYLLSQISHKNIVKMTEAFENDDYFQMVMEKHGDGIDLFEFIDRKPNMDEALASYMFRQVLEATEYLHSLNILHRDIKDENIIVDRSFNLKLIDFGSATYLVKGKLFNTFCGTVEYCSPEVLLGNWYEGRELEMWSLGVTLYTFIFGEHPFFEVEETIRAELFPPFKVSNELMFVICWMLHPEVEFRAKISDIINYPWFTRPVDITKYDYDAVLGGPAEETDAQPPLADEKADKSGPELAQPNVQEDEYRISCSPSSSSLSSSSITSSSITSDDDDGSVDTERDARNDVMKEYAKHLGGGKTKGALSKSF